MPCDYSRYPPDWKARRARVLARAQNRCEWCGVENYAVGVRDSDGRLHTPEDIASGGLRGDDTAHGFVRIVLTVAHLDHDEDNHAVADERLAALCQRCHLAYDHPRHLQHARETRERKSGQLALGLA